MLSSKMRSVEFLLCSSLSFDNEWARDSWCAQVVVSHFIRDRSVL